ncbi:glycosyl transferase [Bacillaceae bacterium JMAK1]|nr:glycosyl transferase [Bacillaceae bacterium JMAK1]
MEKNNLVSIIMPAYNCEKYISESITSVINQKYTFWELIIVDDCSSDNTPNIIKNFSEADERIKFIRLESNSGAAYTRNVALNLSKGRFISFLDSDDTWLPEKLAEQINYMIKNNYYFTCTNYNKIDEYGNPISHTVTTLNKYNYNSLLKYSVGNSTVIYDSKKLGKIEGTNIRKRNDYALWLKVIKKSDYIYGFNKVLSNHRVRAHSISSNKISLIVYHWIVYRRFEQLNLFKSTYLVIFWIVSGVRKKLLK